jgi:hypothetical protein
VKEEKDKYNKRTNNHQPISYYFYQRRRRGSQAKLDGNFAGGRTNGDQSFFSEIFF